MMAAEQVAAALLGELDSLGDLRGDALGLGLRDLEGRHRYIEGRHRYTNPGKDRLQGTLPAILEFSTPTSTEEGERRPPDADPLPFGDRLWSGAQVPLATRRQQRRGCRFPSMSKQHFAFAGKYQLEPDVVARCNAAAHRESNDSKQAAVAAREEVPGDVTFVYIEGPDGCRFWFETPDRGESGNAKFDQMMKDRLSRAGLLDENGCIISQGE